MFTVWKLRRDIGIWESYLAIIFIGISPTFTYVARFIRPDYLVVYLYMGVIHAGWRYAQKPSGLRLMLFLFLSWTASMTHETYVIYFFFMITFGIGNVIHGWWHKKKWSEIPYAREVICAFKEHWWALILGNALGFFWTMLFHTSFFNYTQSSTQWGRFGHFVGQIESFNFWLNESQGHRIWAPFHFYLIHLSWYELPFLVFFVYSIVRVMWAESPGPKRARLRLYFWGWLAASLIIFFFPAFWSDFKGDHFWNWEFGQRDTYWDKKIHMTMGLHLWLFFQCLLVVFVTGWIHLSKGRIFHAMCDYWTVGSFLAYGYAGEKVPWVTAHIVLPMMLSCGMYAAMVIRKFYPDWMARVEASASGLPMPVPSQKVSATAELTHKERRALARKERAAAGETPEEGASLAQHIIAVTTGICLVWTLYVHYITVFRQPGSPIERHSYASSHTHFHETYQYIAQASAKSIDPKDGKYTTPIAFGGQPGWPLNWVLRDWKNKVDLGTNETTKTYTNPMRIMVGMNTGGTQEAEWVIIDSDMMNVWSPKPRFLNRYDWGFSRFRHYWQPEPLKWQTMKKLGLLMMNPARLTPERQAEQKLCRSEWSKFLVAYFIRDEELSRNDAPYQWRSMDGYESYWGKLKTTAAEPPPANP